MCDAVFQLILFSRFYLPVELRFIICENYFPFLPNETNCLTVDELKNFPYFCSFAIYNSIKHNQQHYFLVHQDNSLLFVYKQNDYFPRLMRLVEFTNQDWQTEEEIVQIHKSILRRYRKTVLSLFVR